MRKQDVKLKKLKMSHLIPIVAMTTAGLPGVTTTPSHEDNFYKNLEASLQSKLDNATFTVKSGPNLNQVIEKKRGTLVKINVTIDGQADTYNIVAIFENKDDVRFFIDSGNLNASDFLFDTDRLAQKRTKALIEITRALFEVTGSTYAITSNRESITHLQEKGLIQGMFYSPFSLIRQDVNGANKIGEQLQGKVFEIIPHDGYVEIQVTDQVFACNTACSDNAPGEGRNFEHYQNAFTARQLLPDLGIKR